MMIVDLIQTAREFEIPFLYHDAREFLELVQSVTNYLDLFQHYFPQEYAASMTQVEGGMAPLFPLRGQGYSAHEVRFLTLVNDRLFPLPLDWMIDDASDETRWYTSIPIQPLNELDMVEEYFDELRLGWQLLYYLDQRIEAGFFDEERIPNEDQHIFTHPREPGQVHRQLFDHYCGKQKAPLSSFSLAMEMLWFDTGCGWLDTSSEASEDVRWNRENIDALIEQYREYEDITAKVARFLDWLEADLVNHFLEVLTLWNKTIRDSRKLPPTMQRLL